MSEPGRDKLMVVRELLSQGYGKDMALKMAIPRAHLEVGRGKDELMVVRELLAMGYDKHAVLIAASFKGHLEIVRELLSQGANVNARIDFSKADLLLYKEDSFTCLDVVLALLGRSAIKPTTNDSQTALRVASFRGHLEIVRELLSQGADVDARDEEGGTALMAASTLGHETVVRELLAMRADVNAYNKWGGSARRMAVANGHMEVARLLEEAGARR